MSRRVVNTLVYGPRELMMADGTMRRTVTIHGTTLVEGLPTIQTSMGAWMRHQGRSLESVLHYEAYWVATRLRRHFTCLLPSVYHRRRAA